MAGRLIVAAALMLAACSAGHAAELSPVVSAWIASQTNIHSWSADFVQTRTFKSLAHPLVATGHVWFAEPNRFHWELGNPPQTIAVKAPSAMLVIYPRLKRVERYPLTGEKTGQWRDTLALLETGFPRNEAELNDRFHILSQTVTGQVCQLVMEPKSASARKMMPRFKIAFNVATSSLESTELQFQDGSTMNSQFMNPVLNPEVSPELFNPKLPPDYKVTEPLKGGP